MTTKNRKLRFETLLPDERFCGGEVPEARKVSTRLMFGERLFCFEYRPWLLDDRKEAKGWKERVAQEAVYVLSRNAFVDLIAYAQELEQQNAQLRTELVAAEEKNDKLRHELATTEGYDW